MFTIFYLDLIYYRNSLSLLMNYTTVLDYFKHFIIFLLGLIAGRVMTAIQYGVMKSKK